MEFCQGMKRIIRPGFKIGASTSKKKNIETIGISMVRYILYMKGPGSMTIPGAGTTPKNPVTCECNG